MSAPAMPPKPSLPVKPSAPTNTGPSRPSRPSRPQHPTKYATMRKTQSTYTAPIPVPAPMNSKRMSMMGPPNPRLPPVRTASVSQIQRPVINRTHSTNNIGPPIALPPKPALVPPPAVLPPKPDLATQLPETPSTQIPLKPISTAKPPPPPKPEIENLPNIVACADAENSEDIDPVSTVVSGVEETKLDPTKAKKLLHPLIHKTPQPDPKRYSVPPQTTILPVNGDTSIIEEPSVPVTEEISKEENSLPSVPAIPPKPKIIPGISAEVSIVNSCEARNETAATEDTKEISESSPVTTKKVDPAKVQRLFHPLIHKRRPDEVTPPPNVVPRPQEEPKPQDPPTLENSTENSTEVDQNTNESGFQANEQEEKEETQNVAEDVSSTIGAIEANEQEEKETQNVSENASGAIEAIEAIQVDVEYMIAEYDHPSGKEEELDLEEGDIVCLLERTSDDWFYVSKDGDSCGFVASNYLAEYTGEVPDHLKLLAMQLQEEPEEIDEEGQIPESENSERVQEPEFNATRTRSEDTPKFEYSSQSAYEPSYTATVRENISFGSKIKKGIRKSLNRTSVAGGAQITLSRQEPEIVLSEPSVLLAAPQEDNNLDVRGKIAKEILESEQYYVSVIAALCGEYKPTLLAGTAHMPNITDDDIKLLLNTDSILALNKTILGELENTLEAWNEDSSVGDIFVRFSPFLKMYNQYAAKYNDLMTLYNTCAKDPFFVELVERVDATTPFTARMEALLIAPIQRVPRYTLLLMELRKNTPNEHPDAPILDKAIPLLQTVGNSINETVEQATNRARLMKLSASGSIGLIQPHRKLLQEGVLTDAKSKKIHLILFSDILLHKPESKTKKLTNLDDSKHQWPLHLVWVSDVSQKVKNSFALTGPNASYVLSGEDYKTWMMRIIVATTKHFETLECTHGIQLHSEREAKMNIDDPKRYGSYTFPNSKQFYTGWWLNGLFDGYGRAEFMGDSYEGSWRLNQRCGQGIMTFINGNVYNGDWLSDVQNGHGVMTFENGDVYKGEWKNGVKHGKGEIASKCGASYSGDWIDDLPHGYGKMTYPDGMNYKGNWKNGMRHGNGKYVFQNKDDYNGEWAFDLRNGKGIMRYADSRQYDGTWKDNVYHGHGVYSDSSGTYEGDWAYGVMEGFGTMRYKSGVEYKGNWKRGMYNGNGTITYKMGLIRAYIGDWLNNKKHGAGILQLFNDDVFNGHFKDSFMHGTGTYTFKNGISIKGKWVRGSLANGDSTIYIPEKGDPTKKIGYTGTHLDGRLMSSKFPPIFLPKIPAIDILP